MVFGTLSIGTLIGYEKNKLQQYLKEFSNTYPNISMDICTNEITELLNLVKIILWTSLLLLIQKINH